MDSFLKSSKLQCIMTKSQYRDTILCRSINQILIACRINKLFLLGHTMYRVIFFTGTPLKVLSTEKLI